MTRVVPVYRAGEETFNATVGLVSIVVTFVSGSAVLANAFFHFAPVVPLLSLLFVWGLLLGTVLFLRILFLRPGDSGAE